MKSESSLQGETGKDSEIQVTIGPERIDQGEISVTDPKVASIVENKDTWPETAKSVTYFCDSARKPREFVDRGGYRGGNRDERRDRDNGDRDRDRK